MVFFMRLALSKKNVAESQKRAAGERMRPNRNSIDLVQFVLKPFILVFPSSVLLRERACLALGRRFPRARDSIRCATRRKKGTAVRPTAKLPINYRGLRTHTRQCTHSTACLFVVLPLSYGPCTKMPLSNSNKTNSILRLLFRLGWAACCVVFLSICLLTVH